MNIYIDESSIANDNDSKYICNTYSRDRFSAVAARLSNSYVFCTLTEIVARVPPRKIGSCYAC